MFEITRGFSTGYPPTSVVCAVILLVHCDSKLCIIDELCISARFFQPTSTRLSLSDPLPTTAVCVCSCSLHTQASC